jgi:hypothetical protein
MSRTRELLDACDAGSDDALRRLGWRPVLEALKAWRKRIDGDELAPYCVVLGDLEPDDVAAAVLSLVGESEYRPGAAEVYSRVVERRGGGVSSAPRSSSSSPRRTAPRPDLNARALDAVRLAFTLGAPECGCRTRPVTWLADDDGVLRCGRCDGLEPGQVDAAAADTDLAPGPMAGSVAELAQRLVDAGTIELSPSIRALLRRHGADRLEVDVDDLRAEDLPR